MPFRKFDLKTLILVFALIFLIVLLINKANEKPIIYTICENHQEDFTGITRDFYRYECKTIKRIGGYPQHVSAAKDSFYRIDGAWYVCMDEKFTPVKDACTVLSFGINQDYYFDQEMNSQYGCLVHSFDPFIEADFFANLKNSKNSGDQPTLKVNEKWYFHRLGLTGETKKDLTQLKTQDIIGLNDILKLTNLLNKQIDIVKIDIEGAEELFFQDLNIDYACKYFKQMMMETHVLESGNDTERQKNFLKDLRKLEQCFLLFHRDTRFFLGERFGPTGYMSEFQLKSSFVFNTTYFQDEYFIANYIFSMGELYFVNKFFP
jgi:hypothetical protein